MPLFDDVIVYDAGIRARHLRIGHPIFHQEAYATVTAIIHDADRQRLIVETRGDDDGRTRVWEFADEEIVEVGTITQYGIQRSGRTVMPVHVSHGTRARRMALAQIARRGGQLMRRTVIPDESRLDGGLPLDDFEPAR